MTNRIKTNLKNLVLIAGANGNIGNAFYHHYSTIKETECIGISRTDNTHTRINLEDIDDCKRFADKIDFSQYNKTTLIHCIGIDKLEIEGKPIIDEDHDGIDDVVYKSNVITLFNITNSIINKNKKLLTIVGIGSISDIYNVKIWQSFSKSKEKCRMYIRDLIDDKIRGVMINVSTVYDPKHDYRLLSEERQYWLTPEEVVRKSVPVIDDEDIFWHEIGLFKPNPNYTPEYFKDINRLHAKWKRELGPNYYNGTRI